MSYANKEWANFIPDGSANRAIAAWHKRQPDRAQTMASPSTLTECPRVVWLRYKKHIPVTSPTPWGKAQRLLLGRNFENQIAKQYETAGQLLWHWKDDVAGESVKFGMGEGLTRIEGTPDLLLAIDGYVAISDAKTSRADSFGYVALTADEAFKDPFWHKYKLQVTAYYMLCHKNKEWFQPQPKFTKPGQLEKAIKNMGAGSVLELGGGRQLPLPNICHLFSFALDDGVVRREFTWKVTKADVDEVLFYAKRWNTAYASETMPECTCGESKGTMFCPYAHEFIQTRKGATLATACCADSLIESVKRISKGER